MEFSKNSAQLWIEGDVDGERKADDVINEMFPVQLSKVDHSFEALGAVYPVDIEEIYLRKDLAGKLQSQQVKCLFDHLVGVQARINYPMALKAPVAFHHMFISDESRQDNVAKERERVEETLLEDPESAENWETLGHIWRVSRENSTGQIRHDTAQFRSFLFWFLVLLNYYIQYMTFDICVYVCSVSVNVCFRFMAMCSAQWIAIDEP